MTVGARRGKARAALLRYPLPSLIGLASATNATRVRMQGRRPQGRRAARKGLEGGGIHAPAEPWRAATSFVPHSSLFPCLGLKEKERDKNAHASWNKIRVL